MLHLPPQLLPWRSRSVLPALPAHTLALSRQHCMHMRDKWTPGGTGGGCYDGPNGNPEGGGGQGLELATPFDSRRMILH